MQAQILAPAAVLVLWSMIMLLWMAMTRLPAILGKDKADMRINKPGGRGQDLEGVIDDRINWKSHNYTHLMEQPTIFYTAVVIIALMGAGAIDVLLAWIYMAFRIIHSIWQSTVNKVLPRFALFAISSTAMLILAVRAVMATLFADPGVL